MNGNMKNSVQRLVSVFVMWCLVAGGLLVLPASQVGVGAGPEPPEPMIIPSTIGPGDTFTIENRGVYDANYSFIVEGTLRIVNSTLNFLQTDTSNFFIFVDGGNLILENATITTGATPQAAWDPLFEIVFNGGKFEMTRNSVLAFPGWVNVTGNTLVYVNDSWITSLDRPNRRNPLIPSAWSARFPEFMDIINNPWWFATPRDLTDVDDDGPRLRFENCDNVTIADSRIDELFEYEGLEPEVTMLHPVFFPHSLGISNGTGDENNLTDLITFYRLNPYRMINVDSFDTGGHIDDSHIVHSVILHVAYRNPGYISMAGYDNNFTYSVPDFLEDTIAFQVEDDQAEIQFVELDITADVSMLSHLQNLNVNFTSCHNSSAYGLEAMDIYLIQLNVTLYSRPDLPTNIVLDNTEMTVINSYVSVDWRNLAEEYGLKNAFQLVNGANLYLYGVTISEYESNPTIRDFLEIPPDADPEELELYMPVRTLPGTQAYFYKWSEVSVVDKYAQAVPGANASAEFHFTEQSVINEVARINDHTGDADPTWAAAKKRATDYLGRKYGVTAATFNMTGAGGKVMLPLLTTFINQSNYPTGDHVGEYVVNITFEYGVESYEGYAYCDFMPFPNIEPKDNRIQVQISLDGLALPRDDLGLPGRVVNRHTGDVEIGKAGANQPLDINDFIVVEDGYTLRLTNIDLKILHTGAALFGIIVRGGGTLILENTFVSTQDNMYLTLSIHDTARLIMNNNSRATQYISIYAHDNANVTFNRAILGGWFGTAPGASVQLWAYSTSFGESLDTFTHNSVGHLIGCHSPRGTTFTIEPTGNAVVRVYRWAEITVNGGLMPPNRLQGAHVWINTTNPLFPELNRYGVTDANGLYRVHLLSDYVDSSVSTPHNNYDVDVFYQGNILTHEKEFNLGLATYSDRENTLNDATAARTVVLENVLPDLTPDFTIEVLANDSVGRGIQVWINATVSNIGDASATNVLVRVMDNRSTQPIYQETIPLLEPTQIWVIPPITHAWHSIDDRGPHTITLQVSTLIKEQDYTNNQAQIMLNVTPRPDLAFRFPTDVSFSAPNPLVNREFNILANVWNIGDIPAENVTVSFYETTENRLLDNVTLASVPVSLTVPTQASLPVTFTTNGTYAIRVVIDEANEIEEVRENNNEMSRSLRVWAYPILEITHLDIIEGTNMAVIGAGGGTPIDRVSNRTTVTLRARVQNNGELHASGVYVEFYAGAIIISSSNIIPSISSGRFGYAMLAWDATNVGLQQTHTIRAVAWDASRELTDVMTETITVYDDRPDLEITEVVLANEAEYVTDGNPFRLNVTVTNNGIADATDFSVQVYSSEGAWQATKLLHAQGNMQFQGRLGHMEIPVLGGGETMMLSMTCSPLIVGFYDLFVVVDPDLNYTDTIEYDGITPLFGSVEEYDETNNNATYAVEAVMPELRIILQIPAPGSNVFKEGEQSSILITGLVVRIDNPSIGISGIPISLVVGDASPVTVISGAGGFFSHNAPITAPGNYTVRAYADDINEIQSWFRIDPMDVIPWWIIFLIIILVVAVILGITAYLYFVGLGKTVQCGECGAFIPEGAAKCPKCGVEFETEVAKCSVCGAWVPIDVKNCPDCGTEFTVGTEDLDDYEAKMKRQFEDVVRKFRTEAKKDLGQEFTETEFQAWWAKQPTFITFDQWLKEEEEMKRMGSRPCPVCQMENSVTAKICHKCGSVMGEHEMPEKPKKPEGKMPPQAAVPKAAAKPAEAPKQPPAQQPAQQPAKPAAAPVAAAAPAAAPPTQQPPAAQPGKKRCPSCSMEVNAGEKACPICNYEFPAEGGDPTKRIIRKPIKKVVRRPGEGGGGQ